MTFSYSKEFSSSGFTDLENAFICEYLPLASGDAVKVYLYGLFLCQHPEFDGEISSVAKALQMSEQEIKDCFTFWEEFGLLSVVSTEPFCVQYYPIRTISGGKPRKFKAEKYSDFTKGVQALIPSRMISTGEYTEYYTIMETYSIKPEAMLMIVKYCVDKKGTDISYKYVSKVAKDFGNRGIISVDKIEQELSTYILRSSVIDKILKAMGVKRQPEIEDSTLLKKWTNELGFDADNIIFAAKKLKKGNMQKLDEFLLELYSIKSFSKEEIADYVNKKEEIYNLAIKINKALAIYVDVIDTVVDTYTKKWLSYGFTEESLLSIATYCFKTGKNTVQDMDDLVEHLRAKGYIDLNSVYGYFEREKTVEEFIKKMLLLAGVSRRPNSWDKDNYNVWKTWNFSDEMILEAAKLSAGKSSPIAYINGILSNWKNKGMFNIADVTADSAIKEDNSQESYNSYYEQKRFNAQSKAQKNMEKANSLDGFMAIYSRINGIEKDLAFAEIAGNAPLLSELESEKVNLYKNANDLLKTIGITLDDLSPRYECKKCNDTGYVGTHRCDCFKKPIE